MASELLQSMQFGSNLYDRAQTQRRMTEQINLQVADQVMRQRESDMQHRMREMTMRDALEEKEFQVKEAPSFYKLQNDIQSYLSDPKLETPFPAIPQFKSKAFTSLAEKAQDGLEKYSARAIAEKQRSFIREQQQTAVRNQTKQLSDEIDFALANGNSNYVASLANGGLLETGAPDPAILSQIQQLNAPIKSKQSEARTKALETLTNQRLVGGVAGVKAAKAVDSMMKSGQVFTDAQVDQAVSYLTNNNEISPKDLGLLHTQDSAIKGFSSALDKLDAFEKRTNLKGVFNRYTGPVGQRVFDINMILNTVPGPDGEEAAGIARAINAVMQNYRKNLYGSALTNTEKASFELIASSMKREDFILATRQLRDIMKLDAGVVVERNPFTLRITQALKKEYAPKLFNADSSPSSETNAPDPGILPDGWKFTP